MKNYAKFLLSFACISYGIVLFSSVDHVAIGYLHDKILEETVPELKEFNSKLTALFRIKDRQAKVKATKQLLDFVGETRRKLTQEIKAKKLTPAQIKAKRIVLDIMKRRIRKLEVIK